MYHANHVLYCVYDSKGNGKKFLKVSSKSLSDIGFTSKLQIETLNFVHSSCCLTILELVLSDQLNPDTNIFWNKKVYERQNLRAFHSSLQHTCKLIKYNWLLDYNSAGTSWISTKNFNYCLTECRQNSEYRFGQWPPISIGVGKNEGTFSAS